MYCLCKLLNYSELSTLIYPVGRLFDFNCLKWFWKWIVAFIYKWTFLATLELFCLYYFHNYFKIFFINYILVFGLFLAFRSVLALFICIMFISLCDFFRSVVLQPAEQNKADRNGITPELALWIFEIIWILHRTISKLKHFIFPGCLYSVERGSSV